MPSLRYLLLVAFSTACGAGGQAAPAREFDGQQALAYVREQLAFGPRVPGRPGHAAMAAWLDSLLPTRADTVVVQRWWHHPARGDSIAMTNFVARFNPAARDRVLYLAHWDTRPRTDGPRAKRPDGLVPGANDGASGVAILLGVADALRKQRPAIGVDLLFVDGEDYGDFTGTMADVMIGSRWYASHPIDDTRPLFAVLFDMVGDRDLRLPREENSEVAAPDVVDRVWNTAERMGYGHIFVSAAQAAVTDDHTPLIAAGIRAIDIIDFTYDPWHTEEDTIDKVSAASLEAVGNVAVAVIRGALK